ncbi:DUF86 domain-containing protein [Mycobacterium sp. UM_WGJ]|uniref:HepT-like ribonuclease domain-containing protein n=1 Tax=Mycobacterium sp. UM_WGJ TaxID=1370120 RepID=UPI0004670906|nr:HepT-like ribonuclease domain-containing protein [Mycobacterium sp. UM_WGJ]
MRPESAALIWDALDAAKSISSFIEGISLDAYRSDLLRRRAVERGFEIVGEALGKLRQIDPETTGRVPGLANAVGLRNVLIHGYAEIVDERIYDTAVADVPGLIEVLTSLMAEAGEP